MKLIALHHRLGGFGGHRYNEARGLIDECRRRGWELDLPISVHALPAVVERLAPFARPVLNDPTFDFSRTFEQRVDEFVRQLRAHVEPALTADSRVLVTVATQCEACALARWARSLPETGVPSFFVLFLSDRWNRRGARPDELAEIAAAGRELAQLSPARRRRFVLTASTPGLAAELSQRMGCAVAPGPAHLNYHGLAEIARERTTRPLPARPVVGLLGGARPEKGSHLIPEIVAACRGRAPVRFLVHAWDDGAGPATIERLRLLAADPNVTIVDVPIEREAYERTLAEVDLLLCPYERVNYRQRNSGIVAEGAAAGLPCVVPTETWMAAEIEAGRIAGVGYAGDAPGDAAEATMRCLSDLAGLTRTAARLAGPWRESQSLGAWLDAMESLEAVAVSRHLKI